MKKLILAALAFAATCGLASAQTPTFRICTGSESGNYFYAGNMLAKHAGSAVKVEVYTSTGSTMNLDGILNGQCDGAFVQNDALRVFSTRNPRIIPAVERAAALYPEVLHLACNRAAKVKSLADLTAKHRVAIEDNTGTTVSWEALALAERETTGKVPTDTKSGLVAFNAAADGADVTCAFKVAALNAPLLTEDAQRLSDKIVLVNIDADALKKQTDAKGRPLYSEVTVPASTYKGLMPSGALWGNKAVTTLAVDAVMVVSTEWGKANPKGYEAILRAINRAGPDIRERVGIK